jgi:hypothetical protein
LLYQTSATKPLTEAAEGLELGAQRNGSFRNRAASFSIRPTSLNGRFC